MKIFTRKGLIKKLIIAIIIAITLFSAIIPPKVTYAADEDVATKVGGSLLSPVASLMIGLGDVVMNLMHNLIYDMDQSYILITNKSDGWGIFWTIVAAIVAVVVIAVAAYFTAGASLALLAKFGVIAAGTKLTATAVGTIVVFSIKAGLVAGTLTALSWFGDNIVFPMYQISPEEIFKGEIALLNVNFFRDGEETTDEEIDPATTIIGNKASVLGTPINVTLKTTTNASGSFTNLNITSINEGQDYINQVLKKYGYSGQEVQCLQNMKNDEQTLEWNFRSRKIYIAKFTTQFNQSAPSNATREYSFSYTYTLEITENGVDVLSSPVVLIYKETRNASGKNNSVELRDTPDNFQKIANQRVNTALQNHTYNGEIDIFSSEFWANGDGTKVFKWSNDLDAYQAELTRKTTTTTTGQHTGTSLITSTTYSLDIFKGEWIGMEKTTLGVTLNPVVSKWYYAIRNFVLVVMMVILLYIGIRIILSGVSSEKAKYKNMLMDWVVAICLVFIMHYIMSFAMNVVDGITNIFSTLANGEEVYANNYEIDNNILEKLREALAEYGMNVDDYVTEDEAGRKWFWWDAGNILGIARIKAALCESGTMDYIGYGMVFVVLVLFTLFFLVTYIKRALYLTFFTIMAPLVAMTYPLDKMHDGKAQAFDMWLKEYIFNLMIQPAHLLLYTILISSAFELASTNILYTLVAIGFMMPAEKFIRKMFGFDKAQTPGFLSGAAGAALMMTGMNKLFHRKPSKGGSMTDDGEKSSGKEDKVNVKDDDAIDPFLMAQKGKGQSNQHNNVLSMQEQQRQQQAQQRQMQEALARSQAFKPGDTNPYLPKKPNNTATGFNTSNNVRKQFQQQQKKLQEAQEKAKKSKLKGLKAATAKYAKAKLARTARNIQNGKPIRDISKFVGGAYMGATGALLGATFGIASGEFKNVSGYGATLGAAGYALGSRDMKSDPDMEAAYKEYERAQFESEEAYREYLLEEQRRNYSNNDKYLEQLRTYLRLDDKESARAYMEEYGTFLDAGVTDMEDFAAAVKAVEDDGWSPEMAMTAAKYYKKAGGKPKNMNKRDRENIEYQYKNIVRANGITDDKEVDETVKIMLQNLDRFGSIKDNLTQV